MEAAAAVTRHRTAVADYAAAARRVAVEPGAWDRPLSAGAWSPAQITQHLVLAFEAAGREVREGVPMALRTTAWERLLLRITILRRLLRGGPFPRGARSPREARPSEGAATGVDAETLIGQFEALAAELESALLSASRSDPGLRITHPYFGRLPVAETIYVSARHIEHHRGQLPS